MSTPTSSFAPPFPSPASQSPASPSPAFHLVQAGETLSAIAQKYYGTAQPVSQIFEANRDILPEPNKIYIGQKRCLPSLAGVPAPSFPATPPPFSGEDRTYPFEIDPSYSATSFTERVRFLILRNTSRTLHQAARKYINSKASVHYLVSDSQPAKIFQLVDDKYHASFIQAGCFGGRNNLDDMSLTIEIIRLEAWEEELLKKIWGSSHPRQLDVLAHLCQHLIQLYTIHPTRILSFHDINYEFPYKHTKYFSSRIPWEDLFERGVGAWPNPQKVHERLEHREQLNLKDIKKIQKKFQLYGYRIEATGTEDGLTHQAVRAFQRRFRPHQVSGEIDAETLAILEVLLETYPQ